MTQRRAVQRRLDVWIGIITPESAPLAIFGPAASAAVRELLEARRIDVFTGSRVRGIDEGGITLTPGNRALDPAEAIALPVMEGPAIDGLPADEQGFIPVDDHGRVKGVEDVYAAGDGTNFPIKQGGLGTQQADAAAEHIAHRLGASDIPEPFRPVLRGKLLTGDESLSLSTDVAGGGGEGVASADYLWWPPHKISSRYLAPLLHYGDALASPSRPGARSTSRSLCRRSGTRSRWRLTRTSPRRWTELDAERGAEREHHERSRHQADRPAPSERRERPRQQVRDDQREHCSGGEREGDRQQRPHALNQ